MLEYHQEPLAWVGVPIEVVESSVIEATNALPLTGLEGVLGSTLVRRLQLVQEFYRQAEEHVECKSDEPAVVAAADEQSSSQPAVPPPPKSPHVQLLQFAIKSLVNTVRA